LPMNAYTWSGFSGDEKRQILSDGLEMLTTARRCPHCDDISVRWYYHEMRRFPGRAEMIEWCPSCRHFTTTMIRALSREYMVSDPLDGTRLQELVETKSPRATLWKLDDKWNRGILPQTITPRCP
jgi:hypothetical protein